MFELQESKFLLKNDRALFAFLQITSVCLLKFNFESMITPRYLASLTICNGKLHSKK